MDTELKLLNWRDGQTQAERLCANILILEGFSSVDPQCPLGGPDGTKDILCEKSGWKYLGAVYFPTEQRKFKDIKSKFKDDLTGVAKNDLHGIIFLTNQKLSPTEKRALVQGGKKKGYKTIIYSCERIRGILDSPIGFSHRLEYLGIEMSKEDQLSFFSGWGNLFEGMLQKQSDRIINEISKRIAVAGTGTAKLTGMMQQLYVTTQNTASLLTAKHPPSDKASFTVPISAPTTDQLDVKLLCMLHRAVCFDDAYSEHLGKFRNAKIWIGGAGSTPENARYTPPPPGKVPDLTEALLKTWREQYVGIMESNNRNTILAAIVRFHYEFLSIHPFLDGNGRVSRFLLMQQASEMLKCKRRVILEDRAPYLNALNSAQKGDLEPLTRVITQALFGEEDLPGKAAVGDD